MISTSQTAPHEATKAAGPAQASPGKQSRGIPNLKDHIPRLEPRRRKAEAANPMPVPETPAAPPRPDPATVSFTTPTRRILSPKDHQLFLSSPTYALILSFIFGLSESVLDKPISAVKDADLSPTVRSILSILDEADSLCRDTLPDDQGGSRFGNKTFRVFLDKVKQRSPSWHTTLLNISNPAAAAELSTYLNQSFGNRARIDYGSGHELNFFMWLLCLHQLSLLHRSDFPALALRVFARYLALMRRVQGTYYLEPAGSHGVWGLDDYQFLPFLLGASQLVHHAFLTPRAVHQDLALEESGPDYLYLGQVAFVNSTKTVRGLRWHSPMLDDISSARSWAKIEGGMRRMFVTEVLGKLPVMQHFLFGALIPAAEGMSEARERDVKEEGEGGEEEEEEGGEVKVFDDKDGVRHVHQQVGWGDCCGIKVPSSIGAAEELKKRGAVEQLRRIPFD
ncbi:Phosphotyrosyl phosphatase activator [Parathielavia hyrcaniae]|uniref:Serine/threonine-protein phosphatase 2A activator n=1 Tax=Parathielavia hyrcaniae TaxID=113614 RepID=A0AAN6PVR4_9PEZI|nr:Phosphotyrosyl phosphatase activator [Parathielavia hyrcaniae]